MKSMIFLLLLFEIIFCTQSDRKFYRCGYGNKKFDPKPLNDLVVSNKKNSSYSRILEEDDGFKDLNIYFDFENLKSHAKDFGISDSYLTMIINAINKATKTLGSLLRVVPPVNTPCSPATIQSYGIDSWNQTFPIFMNPARKGMRDIGVDMVIFGKFDNSLEDDVFASSEAKGYDPNNDRIITGVLYINSKINLEKTHSDRYLTTIMLHELTHLLGFEINFINYNGFFKQERDSQGILHSYITSPKVIEVAKKYFKCDNDIKGIEVEDNVGSVSSYSHWDARYLLGEYMNYKIYTEEEVISEFTLALLEDLKFFKAKYYTGGLMRYGKGKGCEFLLGDCINRNTEKTPFKNEFFDSVTSKIKGENNYYYDAACSSGRQSKAYHYFLRFDAAQASYIYFKDNIIGSQYTNGCPVGQLSESETENDYYAGRCSSLGSKGDYGDQIYYQYEGPENVDGRTIYTIHIYFNSSAEMLDYTGEAYSDHSHCYQSSLYKNSLSLKQEKTRAVCYESFCSNRSLTIKIFNDYFVCPRKGGKVLVEGYKGMFFCPDYYLVCSGTVMCNDMYDCVDKKSEAKEDSYNYDYIPETNQMLSEIEGSAEDNTNNYELSDDGICPQYCKKCLDNKVCVICKENCYELRSKTNSAFKGCLPYELANIGHYKENNQNIYYKCLDKCEKCTTGTNCQKCIDGYLFTLGRCIKIIDNCLNYALDYCEECNNGYAFKEDNRMECFNIVDNFKNHYTKDKGISYYPCNSDISNCNKCYYNSGDNKVKCYLCDTNFVVLQEDYTCINKEDLDNRYKAINDTHVDLCNNILGYKYYENKCVRDISYCKTFSEDGESCAKCNDGYAFKEDNRMVCLNIAENFQNYYTKDEGISYFTCNSEIGSCDKCYYNSGDNKLKCYLCETDYVVFQNDYTCINKYSLDNHYKAINDTHVDLCNNINGYKYYENKCVRDIGFCKTYSEDGESCVKCNDGYAFEGNDRMQCFNIEDHFQNYYTKDEGISYFACNSEIENCNKCYYNSGDKKVKCYLCDTNFAMFENDNKCLNKESLDNSYININDTHVKLCENVINYCKECTNEKTCTKCSNGFLLSMTNDGSKYCINESILQSGEVYLSEDDSTYLYCSEPAYHDIPNCHKCSDKTSCSLCKSQFTFIDGDKSKCVEINSLSNNYIKDPKDSSNYIKCENIYGNCNTCNNERCLTCQEKYEFVNNDYSTCVEIIIPPTQSNISPTNENTNKPNEESTNKPNEESTNKPNEESTNKPNEESTNKPNEESTNKPNEESTNKPNEESTNKPNEDSTNKPNEESTNKPNEESTNKPNEESTNKPNEDSTNKPNEESTNKPNDQPTNNDEEEDTENDNNGTPVITKDEALQKASISLSYEKINNFNYNKDEKKINYDLSVLTTVGEIKTGDEINVNVNLIYSNGTRSTESVESTCKVQNLEEQSSTVRATFLCTIENVEGDYYSLRYNNSDNICGVPKDETSLDPVLTKKYKNNDDTKILPSFSYESIDHNTCRSTGIFTIKGKMSEKINENIKFTFPLTYPEGTSLTCQFNEEQDELTCKPDRDIIDKTIIIEQTVISQGNVDYFNLKSITSSERLICSNGILKESEEKSNVPITFRQVSHIQRDTNGFSFILIALASEKIEQGTSIQANIYVNNEKIDRTIDCILQNNVNPGNGQTQGNFLCSADKNTNDYWNSIDFSNISVSLSPNNDNIGGVAELDETSANPSKTDEEISKIKEKKQNNEEINSLTNVIDYYEENNEINTFTLESIDVDKCNTTGKLKIKGSFSNDFEEEINFNLPLTYPSVELKCELKKVTQKTVINIECKSKSDFKSVDSIVIEPRIIKKKNQELFMINGKTFKLNGKRSCANYDTIKNEILENRENSEVAFAAMSALAVVNQALEFLMGFSRESENVQFPDIYTFLTSLTLSTRRRLRILEETTISDIPITCNLNQNLVVGLIGGYNCGSDTKNIQGTPLSMKFDTDDIMDIAGIDNINLQTTSSNNIDFTNIENLKIMNELPQVDINNIDGNTCSENGQYIIYGNISSISNVEALYSDIEILISSTESTSLCEVEINKNNNNLTMICQNKDKFDMSRIMISKSFVKNSTGNFIFIINSYTSPEQFACDISLNSVKITTAEDEDKESNIYDSGNRFSMRTAGTNISAGTIVAIVIPIVVGLIAVIIVFILMKKGILSGKKDESIGESTIKRLGNEPGITH